MDRERLKGNLDLLLLSVLASGPTHGYAIISALRDRSEGTFDLPEGTIYPALHRLEDAGLLASTWAQAEGRRRRVYGLTDQRGRRAGRPADRVAQVRRRGARGARLGGPGRLAAGHGPGPGRAGVVGMIAAGTDLIAGYLAELRAGLWVPAAEAELIVAEAEDHLRETAAVRMEIGMTELEAHQAAISSFGPVRAVIRAHRRRTVTAGDAVMAAWKLTGLLASDRRCRRPRRDLLAALPHGLGDGRPPVQDGPAGLPVLGRQVPITIPAVMALPYAAMAAGGLALLATRQLATRRLARRGTSGRDPLSPAVTASFFLLVSALLSRAQRERRGGAHPSGSQLDHPDLVGLHDHDRSPGTGCHRRRVPGGGPRLRSPDGASGWPGAGRDQVRPLCRAAIRCPRRPRRASSFWYRRCCSRST